VIFLSLSFVLITTTLFFHAQGSSIGSYNPAWLDEFLGSARGASPETWLDDAKTKRVKEVEARVKREGYGADLKVR
jgi:tyrosyl-DNA phosphodiesterase-1